MTRPARSERGFVLIAVTFAAMTLLGVAGMAVDLGRMYVARSEAQSFCDAAAVAAAVQLDGTSKGISAAKDAVTGLYGQPWNWGDDKLTTPEVDFASGLGGPWSTNPTSLAGYMFARVRTSVPVRLYLLPAVLNAQFGTVSARAVAAQVPVTSLEQGLAPYTVVSTDDTSPDLGLVPGHEYSLQWPQYNATRNGCGPQNPAKCFNSPPCSGDPSESLNAVVEYWGANINGYWGSNQNSEIAAEVLDLIQLRPIAIGDLIPLTSGNKNAQAKVLDERVNQDLELLKNTAPAYFASSVHNGRRLIGVPVTKPSASGTHVTGFASFLLLSSGAHSNFYSSGNGNDPFCAVYVGPYVIGSTSPGASTGTGAFRVSLVQ